MLGWHVNVYPRPEDLVLVKDGYSLRHNAGRESLVASWSANLNGMDWMLQAVREGSGLLLAPNGGYPMTYEIERSALISLISPDPPFLASWSSVVWHRNPKMLTDRVIVDFWDQS